MKSINKTFEAMKKRDQRGLSLHFGDAIRGRGYNIRTITFWFNELVEKGEESEKVFPSLKKQLFEWYMSISKPLHDRSKSGDQSH